MRKLTMLIMIGLGWGWTPPQTGQAISLYDPVQGGLFWEPPAEMWIPAGKIGFVPFAYAASGEYDTNEEMKITGTTVSLTPNKTGTINVYKTSDHLGVTIIPEFSRDWQLDLKLTPAAGSPVFERTVIVHAEDSKTVIRQPPRLPPKRLLTPLPILVETVNPKGSGFFVIRTFTDGLQQILQTRTGGFYDVTVPGRSIDPGIVQIDSATRTFNYAGDSGEQSGSVAFGLAPITATGTQPIKLASAYLEPRPGTELTFEWRYRAAGAASEDSRTTRDPWLTVPEAWHRDGQMQMRLHYAYAGKVRSVYSDWVPYHYQPQALPKQSDLTTSVAALLEHSVTLPAGWPDWQIDQPGSWQLEVAVDPLQSTEGAQLAADLILPDGTAVAAGQARRRVYNSGYNLALTQAKWLLQQQPDVLRGRYQTRVRFTVISGPE